MSFSIVENKNKLHKIFLWEEFLIEKRLISLNNITLLYFQVKLTLPLLDYFTSNGTNPLCLHFISSEVKYFRLRAKRARKFKNIMSPPAKFRLLKLPQRYKNLQLILKLQPLWTKFLSSWLEAGVKKFVQKKKKLNGSFLDLRILSKDMETSVFPFERKI